MINEILQRQERARKLMSDKGFGALVLASAENIQYLTGAVEPSLHACGVLVVPQKATTLLLGVLWLDREAAEKQTEAIRIEQYTPDTQGKVIAKALERLEVVEGTIGMDDRALTVLESSLKEYLPHVNLVNASNVVEELRWVKSEEEIRLIQKACEIADLGMKVALESVKRGTTELQIAARAEHEMITLGSDRLKHPTIVASGSRAVLVHPFATQKMIAAGDVVAIDLGGVCQGYCSDISRTLVVGGPSEATKNDFDVLRKAQETVLRKLRPGVSMKEIEAAAREITQGTQCQPIGHIGHSIGLRVEEQPRLRSTMTPYPDLKIENNMVFALFQSAIQSSRSSGIRLEDTVIVTESGARTLTTYARELFS